MALKTITGANAIYMLGVTSVFPTPVQLQGFAADDVFDTDVLESAEVLMGVDGIMSGGFVFVPVKQNVTLQADSDSNDVFDAWWQAMQTSREMFYANATITIRAVGKKFTLTKGALTGYKPIPDTKKLLQPRKFSITWNTVAPAAA
jgi:hypothetical protein